MDYYCLDRWSGSDTGGCVGDEGVEIRVFSSSSLDQHLTRVLQRVLRLFSGNIMSTGVFRFSL